MAGWHEIVVPMGNAVSHVSIVPQKRFFHMSICWQEGSCSRECSERQSATQHPIACLLVVILIDWPLAFAPSFMMIPTDFFTRNLRLQTCYIRPSAKQRVWVGALPMRKCVPAAVGANSSDRRLSIIYGHPVLHNKQGSWFLFLCLPCLWVGGGTIMIWYKNKVFVYSKCRLAPSAHGWLLFYSAAGL